MSALSKRATEMGGLLRVTEEAFFEKDNLFARLRRDAGKG